MPQRLGDIVRQLEDLARYSGPWRPLRHETELLGARVEELKQREERLDDMLIVALVGGSGVGKSSLLNAIAGDTLAKASEFRPCTSTPTVYQPPGAQIPFPGWLIVSGSALENLILIDTPDSDTIAKEHREIVIQALEKCDLILICGSPEKYLDEATWSLLRPLQNERTMVCVETKASLGETVKDHWLGRMNEQGFKVTDYFRVDNRRTLDRKLNSRPVGDDEFDFPRLERFLSQELDREHVRRIKRSNATGLLVKTLDTLHDHVSSRRPDLEGAAAKVDEADEKVLRDSYEVIRERLFAEPHLWNYALGREVSVRAKGIIGAFLRTLETIRTLPTRMVNWIPTLGRGSAGHQAAALLGNQELFNENVDLASGQIEDVYRGREDELSLVLTKAGFDWSGHADGFKAFDATLQQRIATVLRGPARDRLVQRARILTSWPIAILADLPPIILIAYTCYRVVVDYFTMMLPAVFFFHGATVLAIMLSAEILILSAFSRLMAWSARRGAVSDLRAAMFHPGAAFEPERTALASAADAIDQIESVRKAVKE